MSSLSNCDNQFLDRIKYKSLTVLIGDLKLYKPKSKIKHHIQKLVEYLIFLDANKNKGLSKKEIVKDQTEHIVPIILTIQERFKGYATKSYYIYIVLLSLIPDSVLYFFTLFGLNYKVPIFTIMAVLYSIWQCLIAYQNNKLW